MKFFKSKLQNWLILVVEFPPPSFLISADKTNGRTNSAEAEAANKELKSPCTA